MAQLQFNAQNAPTLEARDALPAGWYDAMITATEMKPTKAGDGAYLACTFNIVGPAAYSGRKVFMNMNLKNPNPTAQEIAYKQLASICHAIGVMQVQDSSQLHNIPMKIRLKVKPAQGEYEASNEITGFDNVNSMHEGPAPVAAGIGAPAGFAAPAATAGFAAPVAPAPAAWQPPAQAQQPWQQQAPQQAPVPQAPQQWQQPPVQQAPVQQPAFAQAPVQEAPVQQVAPPAFAAPVQQAPVQQAPVPQPPVPQAPAAGAPVPPWAQPQQ